MWIQLLLVLVLGAALALTIRRLRQGVLTRVAALAWGALWVGGIAVVLHPDVTTRFARWVGVGRGVDAVLYLSVAFLLYLAFRIFLRLEKLERDLTTLVRAQALAEREAASGRPPEHAP
jgi:hypothetical protein